LVSPLPRDLYRHQPGITHQLMGGLALDIRSLISWSASIQRRADSITANPPQPMALLPRWRYMTDEAKALTKRSAVSALVVLLVLLVFRPLLLWAIVAIAAWWLWKTLRT